MNNIPGAFPTMQGPVPSNRAIYSNNIHDRSAEAVYSEKSLKSRMRSFHNDLSTKLRQLWLVLSIVGCLYDCSLLILVARYFGQWGIETYMELFKLKSKSPIIYIQLFLQNILVIALHIVRDLPKPEDDGFVYGHHVVQLIGQKQLKSKWLLYLLDAVIWYIQALVYSSMSTVDNKTTNNDLIDYDGTQGRVIALKIKLMEAIRPIWVGIRELEAQEEHSREVGATGGPLEQLLSEDHIVGNDYGAAEF